MKFKEIIHLLMAFMALSVLSSGLSVLFWDLSVILFRCVINTDNLAFRVLLCLRTLDIKSVQKTEGLSENSI